MSTNCTHFNHIPHQSRIPIPFFAGKDPSERELIEQIDKLSWDHGESQIVVAGKG